MTRRTNLFRATVAVSALLLLTVPAGAAELETGPSGWPVLELSTLERARAASDNFRLTLDLSQRAVHSDSADDFGFVTALGIDSHKVFTDDSGDRATLTLQGYLTRIDDMPGAPPFFEGPDDWEFVFRIFNANLHVLPRQALNVRVGHFELPFGLEHSINTNGTLRDFTHGANLGIKADWGVSVNGILPRFEYELGVTRGVADEAAHERTYLVSGRLGTPSDHSWVAGLSFMHGRLSNERAVGLWKMGLEDPAEGDGVDHVLRRTRVGADLQWHMELASLLAEISWGRDYDDEVWSALVEIDRELGMETSVYLQGRRFGREWQGGRDHATTLALGARYTPDTHWALSAQLERELHTFGPRPGDTRLAAQLRYRF